MLKVCGTYGHSKTLGPLAKNLLIQTLENVLKDKKQKWIILGIRNSLFEESLNQIKEENQTHLSKKEGLEIVEFWENVAAATYSF